MRCLALASELTRQGATCKFISRALKGNPKEELEGRGYASILLPARERQTCKDPVSLSNELNVSQSDDFILSYAALKNWKPDWVVVDHYGIDAEWEEAFQKEGIRIMVIDDLANRKHLPNILLDQTFGRDLTDYDMLVPSHTKTLLGSKYALLRKEFAEHREKALMSRDHRTLKNLLINFGGVDEHNYTGKALRSLVGESSINQLEITIVLGTQSPWVKEVSDAARDFFQRVTILQGANNMAQLMSEADLAIGAAGSTSWERCSVGLPTIQYVVAENQRQIANNMAAVGAIKLLRSFNELSEAVRTAPTWMKSVSNRCRYLADGLGARRVVEAMGMFK